MVDRPAEYQKLQAKIELLKNQAEYAKWSMAQLIYDECQDYQIADVAEMFDCGKHHIIYMYNCWDRRALRPDGMTFSTFYNSDIVRRRDPRKPPRKEKIPSPTPRFKR